MIVDHECKQLQTLYNDCTRMSLALQQILSNCNTGSSKSIRYKYYQRTHKLHVLLLLFLTIEHTGFPFSDMSWSRYSHEWTEENHEQPVRITCAPVKIRIGYPPNTHQARWRWANIKPAL